MISVVVVDDQTLVREGIKGLLNLMPDMQIIGEACDGVEAVEHILALSPDVVLMDIRMPRLDGIEAIRALSAQDRLPPTLVLTTFDDGDIVIEAIRAGAKGVMLKGASLDELARAIRVLAAHGTAFQPAMTDSLIAAITRTGAQTAKVGDAGHAEALSAREREVLHLICAGYSNREIAGSLSLAEGTVKNHVSNILTKLNARDRTHAVLKALQAGHLG